MQSRSIIAIRGNIGSGKSTLLKKMFDEAEETNPGNTLILEPVDEWEPFLEAFRKNPNFENRMALQKKVSEFAKTTWETITGVTSGSVFVERTVGEHIAIFLDGGSKPEFAELIEFYKKWNYDSLLTEVIDLDVPAEECFHRISKRGQHGDDGITLDYIKFLEEKYSRLFYEPTGAVTFTGNIGSGKSTAIEVFSREFPHAKMFKERVDVWGPDLTHFKKTHLPEDLVTLQCKIASCAKEVYQSIEKEPEALALVERSVEENINVFVKPHFDSGFISKAQYDEIVSIWDKWNYDKLSKYTCVMSTSVDECYNRIQQRGQAGDSSITLDYLNDLDKIYDSMNGPILHEITSPIKLPWMKLYKKSDVIAVTGNIGAGKSTLIRKMEKEFSSQGKKVTTLLEPVDEWGDDLCRFKQTQDPQDLVTLQKNIASFSKRVYNTLLETSSNKFLIERSNFEHLKIFCEPSLKSGFLNPEQYSEATADYRDYDFDRFITEIIHLDVSHEECYRRIVSRGQEGDSSIDPEYIKYLGELYKELYGNYSGVKIEIRKN